MIIPTRTPVHPLQNSMPITRRAKGVRPSMRTSSSWEEYIDEHRGFYRDVERARSRTSKRLAEIRSASPRKQRELSRVFLRDTQIRLAFSWGAVVAHKRYDLTPDQIREIGLASDPFVALDERVCPHVIRPWGRKPRAVIQVGTRRLARQRLVAALVRALHPPSKYQFFGRGVPAALNAVEEFIRAGFTHGAEIDVVNFYPSIPCSDELKRLLRPLPETVIEKVVFDPGIALVETNLEVGNPNSGRRRLPIGSACSAAAGEIVMKAILGSLPEWPIVNYHDNVFVFGHSQREINARLQAIRDIARCAALGDLEFGQPTYWASRYELTFLGQTVDPSENPRRWRPAESVLSRYLAACEGAGLKADVVQSILRGLEPFRRTYPQWKEGDTWLPTRRAELATLLFFETGELTHGNAAIDAIVQALAGDDRLRSIDVMPAPFKREHSERWHWLVRELEGLAGAIEDRDL